MRHFWSPDELDAIRSGMEWAEFSAQFPHRTYRAWVCKRGVLGINRLLTSGAIVTVAPPLPRDEMETRWAHLEQANDIAMHLRTHQDSTTFTAPEDGKPIAIIWTGDWHVGASGVDYQLLRHMLDTVAATEGVYAVGMGDYSENTKPQGKSGNAMYSGLFNSPDEQMAYLISRMELWRGRWVAIAGGNHDAFDGRWAGIDRLPALCQHLGAPYFTEKGGTIFFHIGTQEYRATVRHNHRFNSSVNKSNSQRNLWNDSMEFESSHIITLAHTHEPLQETVMRRGQPVIYQRSGTLKYLKDSWAESNGWKPAFAAPVTILFPNEHKIIPFLDWESGLAHLQMLRR